MPALRPLGQAYMVREPEGSFDLLTTIGVFLGQQAAPLASETLLFTKKGRKVLHSFGGVMHKGADGIFSSESPGFSEKLIAARLKSRIMGEEQCRFARERFVRSLASQRQERFL